VPFQPSPGGVAAQTQEAPLNLLHRKTFPMLKWTHYPASGIPKEKTTDPKHSLIRMF
jgi:hypothetical protein